MSTTLEPPPSNEVASAETSPDSVLLGEEISLLDLLLVLAAHRRSILRVVAVAAFVGVVVALLLPKYYSGTALIMTPIAPMSLSDAVSGNLGALAGLGSAGDSLGLTDPNAVYLAMLNSRTVGDRIIDRFHLTQYYRKSTHVDTLKALSKDTEISSGRDGTITIEFLHKDPKLAADIANAYVDELQKLTQDMSVGRAAQRRKFFENEFAKAKDRLSAAEVALKKSQEGTGVLDLDKQATAVVTAIADLRGQIAAQEILIRGMKSFATSRNPDLVRAEQQLAAMRAQLRDMENRSASGDGDIFISTRNIPTAGLEYVRNLRNVKYYETVYEMVAKLYEAAAADEGSSGDVIQVVQKAVPVDKKSKPKRTLIVLAFVFAGLLLSYTWALGVEICRRIATDPTEGPKLKFLQSILFLPDGWRVAWRAGWVRGTQLSSRDK